MPFEPQASLPSAQRRGSLPSGGRRPRNRVAHAYLRLASDAGRDWLREHPHAKAAQRYQLVESFVKLCKSMAEELVGLGIGLATADIQPNYVLLENRTYATVREAWERLLRREKTLDELWAWQAQPGLLAAGDLARHGGRRNHRARLDP